MIDQLTLKALQIAAGEVGVMEDPPLSNRGPRVDEYVRAVGLDPAGGHAWCQAFVYWCFEQAAKELGIPNPCVKTAGVLDHWNRTKGRKFIGGIPTAQYPGLLFVILHGAGLGHTGFVESVDGISLITIEGNTNDGGSREGVGVFRRRRPLASIGRFVDYGAGVVT